MKMDTFETRVIFRKWDEKHNGGIIAWLLDVEANPGKTMAYEHVGQHGEGDYFACLGYTTPATLEESNSLWIELTNIGYDLITVKRYNRKGTK
jgi:hypothetical protein